MLSDVIDEIDFLMRRFILIKNENGHYKPIKGTTAQDCYRVLFKIQELLKSDTYVLNDKGEFVPKKVYFINKNNVKTKGEIYEAQKNVKKIK